MRINKEAVIIGVVSVAFLGLMGYLISKSTTIAPTEVVSDLSLLSNASSHMTGKADAKVTLVEFGDYQCPACGQAHPSIKSVTDAYASNPDFNFVFRNFPLPQHANAQISAEAAEAAGAQGKYWEMHDMLYENQAEWSSVKDPTEIFSGYAAKLGLSVSKFTTDLSREQYREAITSDLNDGNKAGVNATPTLYVNGAKLSGYDAGTIKAAVEAALAK